MELLLDKYSSSFEMLLNNPALPLNNLMIESLIEILKNGKDKIISISLAEREGINSYVKNVATLFDKEITRVIPDNQDNYIFYGTNIFPSASIVWLLSELYIVYHYGEILDWIGDKIAKKSSRLLKKNNGIDAYHYYTDIIESNYQNISNNWVTIIFESATELVDTVSRYKNNREEKVAAIRRFVQHLLELYDINWNFKTVSLIDDEIDEILVNPYENKANIITLLCLSYVTNKPKVGKITYRIKDTIDNEYLLTDDKEMLYTLKYEP